MLWGAGGVVGVVWRAGESGEWGGLAGGGGNWVGLGWDPGVTYGRWGGLLVGALCG